MTWRWWVKDDEGLERARQADQDATVSLEEARSRWPEVHELSAWARQARERNHLTELFFATRGRR